MENTIRQKTALRCRSCGFAFAEHDRLGKPGRCAICKGYSIEKRAFGWSGF